jgi:hypothetical protein
MSELLDIKAVALPEQLEISERRHVESPFVHRRGLVGSVWRCRAQVEVQ